jgi:multicomponent K+:H+ antiporter subunit C
MEFLVASGVGVMTAAGTYLLLRGRTFPVIIGLALLSYAINVFLFATGRLVIDQPPIISETATGYTDPLPQALVLTAIVISFGMTAVIVVLALRAYLESGTDAVDIDEAAEAETARAAEAATAGAEDPANDRAPSPGGVA